MRGLDARCRAIGHPLGEAELERVYRRVTALADRSKSVSDEQLEAIVREEAVQLAGAAGGARLAAMPKAQGAACR